RMARAPASAAARSPLRVDLGGPAIVTAAAPSPPFGYRQSSMRRVRDRLPALPFPALLVLAAGWWVFGYIAPRPECSRIPSYVIYPSSSRNIVYALRSLRDGHGLL